MFTVAAPPQGPFCISPAGRHGGCRTIVYLRVALATCVYCVFGTGDREVGGGLFRGLLVRRIRVLSNAASGIESTVLLYSCISLRVVFLPFPCDFWWGGGGLLQGK